MAYRFRSVYSTKYFTVEEGTCAGDEQNPYYRICAPDSVVSFVLDEEDQFVMVRQYRPNLGHYTLESPAGGVRRQESPINAIRRELIEEVGLTCALLPVGGTFHLMMNRTSIKDYIFFGMFPKPINGFIPEVGIEVERVDRKDLLARALVGDYVQLAGLGILQLVSGMLSVDLWNCSFDEIERAFQIHPGVKWTP